MNVTSMLSGGYLQPIYDVPRPTGEEQAPPASLSTQEQQILAQERGLKAAHGPDAKVSTTYRYSVGPDGRRYISGAYVSIESGDAPSGEARASDGERKKVSPDERREKNKETASGETADFETESAVRELKRIEQEVVAHEAAHQAAGGGLTGAATYSYTQGPDGRSYITGGEVSIQVPVSDDPEQTLRDMELVQRAALAPNSPSGQDLSVAASAAAAAASARQELAAKNREEAAEGEKEGGAEFSPGISSVMAGLLFERIHGENQGQTAPAAEKLPDGARPDPKEAYDRNASAQGLWTLRRGFEPIPKMIMQEPGFDIAA